MDDESVGYLLRHRIGRSGPVARQDQLLARPADWDRVQFAEQRGAAGCMT